MRSPRTTYARTPHRSWLRWSIPAAILLSIGAYFLLHAHGSRSLESQKRAQSEGRSTTPYINRALLRGPLPAQGPAQEGTAISGHVYGTNGAPIGGAAVAAMTFEVAGNLPSISGAAVTDDRGHFELRVPEGSYQVHANKAGHGPSYLPARSGETVSLVLTKSGILHGRVVDARGPVQRFSIDVLTAVPDNFAAPAPLWSKRIESPDGAFTIDELPAWPVIVRAVAEGRAPAFSQPVRVGADETKELDIALVEGCTLEGTVKDAQGEPVAGVFIDAETRMVAGQMNNVSMEAARQAVSGEDGHFSIGHVPTGEVLVRGYDGDHAVSTAVVKIASCNGIAPVGLRMSDGGSITGVARGSDGAPLPGARLTLTQRALGFVTAMADEKGRYRFDDIPMGQVNIELAHGGQRTTVSVRVENEDVVKRDIALHATGSGEIEGRVTAGDRPLAGVQILVAANRGKDNGFDMRYLVTDNEGVYRAQDVPPGPYFVSVMSTSTSGGVEVEENDRATLDLDVSAQRRPQPPRERKPRERQPHH
jgi:protocatechuate 3,4-dioxygenase beta subunit